MSEKSRFEVIVTSYGRKKQEKANNSPNYRYVAINNQLTSGQLISNYQRLWNCLLKTVLVNTIRRYKTAQGSKGT